MPFVYPNVLNIIHFKPIQVFFLILFEKNNGWEGVIKIFQCMMLIPLPPMKHHNPNFEIDIFSKNVTYRSNKNKLTPTDIGKP
jgi:hypothetical protein